MVNFEIDISDTLAKFSDFFENSKRMILSAKFGDGKTYLLDKFMRQDNPKNPKYYFVILHPVNYVVEDNRDIFEYIKRDILFQLLQDDMLLDTEESLDRLVEAISENISFSEVCDFLSAIAPIPGFESVAKLLGKCTIKVSEIRKTYQDKKMLPYNYVNSFTLKTGSIAECDGFTRLIQETLRIIEETHQCQTVLIIEDMDRLDPAHLFRILNILGANIDNPYFVNTAQNEGDDQEGNPNKFGFSKILLVMDYETSEHIFHHFYGEKADYEGYMQKFLDNPPFTFSLRSEAQNKVREKIRTNCKIDDNFFGNQLKDEWYSKTNPKIIDFINELSVRRCKQIILQDVDSHIRKDENSQKYIRTLRVLVYMKLIVSDKYRLQQIYHSIGSDIDTFMDIMFPVIREVGKYNAVEYSRKKIDRFITYQYNANSQLSTAIETYGGAKSILSDDMIRSMWRNAEKIVLSHIDLD